MSDDLRGGFAFPPPRARLDPDVWARAEPPEPELPPIRWRLNALLFAATVLSVFFTGAVAAWDVSHTPLTTLQDKIQAFAAGWTFAVPLLVILLFHEFGHYIAARAHRVDASLPYFLPLPLVSPFGTLGAIIAMRGHIRSRNALLDIGASGPLAGLFVAIPVLALGLSLSAIVPEGAGLVTHEGQSLLYLALKRLVVGVIPEGYDVQLHPTAFAGWAGLLVTMLNLLPWGQLDGGHVAYALFGYRQNRYAQAFRAALVPLFLYNASRFIFPRLLERSDLPWGFAISNSVFWLMWFVVLGVIARLSGGAEHPPTEGGELSRIRRIVAVVTLILFVLLFMPTPYATY